MKDNQIFDGFSKETLSFFRKLKRNNNKEWFDKHRGEYDRFVLEPAKAFVVSMGEKFHKERVDVHAEPKLNRAIFRIYRDTRFSPDKTPYKTHLALFFWEGKLPRMESPGFYFHVEPTKILFGLGIYGFSPKQLTVYRKAVVDPEWGKELASILAKISRRKDFKLGEKHYKRIPSDSTPITQMLNSCFITDCMCGKRRLFLKNFILRSSYPIVGRSSNRSSHFTNGCSLYLVERSSGTFSLL
jgi:uncharacterized protein (TIGR02453 family)